MGSITHASSPIGGPGPAFENAGGISGNRTVFTGNTGALNNNQWNNLMNPNPMGQQSATADFGKCNALILRCAQPKCSGCTSMDLAVPIVNGCVQSNPSCKQHGDALVQTLAAQIVSNNTAKASTAAAQNAAAQSNAQMEQMQQQMQQMQQQMQEQSAQSVAAVQQALEEQKQLAAQQAAAAVAAATTTDAVIADAAEAGVSTDVLAREQIGGQILTSIENAEINMKSLKNIMQDTFDYAKCDSRGNNCAGPKRVKTFKAKAQKFFDPYESVLDEIYDAVILAQSLGVDINDIYMLLSGGCNRWGRYVCQCVDEPEVKDEKYTGCIKSQAFVYDASNCDTTTNLSKAGTDVNKFVIEGKKCKIGDMIPYNAGGCMPLGPLDGDEPVQEAMLNAENGTSGTQRIG
ncbi:MAG: hypothetical protein GX944_00470, partial [Alphaproteobacteria bacterium]|nr:hypothetical protein [Alphaproteobacteria bacterium]